jgi:hypothetical protein
MKTLWQRAPRRRLTVALGTIVVAIAVLAPSALANMFSIGGSMEGDLKVDPGTTLSIGYDLAVPGTHQAMTVAVVHPGVDLPWTCVSGPGSGVINVAAPDASYDIPQNNGAWYPSGDQASPSVWQGHVVVPNVCNSGRVRFQRGGTFTADLQASDTTEQVSVRWHYSAKAAPNGSWSGTAHLFPSPLDESGSGGTL